MTDLTDQLKARADALVQRSLDAMYANPFWLERYGERGRRFAEEDGHHHIKYLVLALAQKRPQILVEYARWLQVVLTSRGMCSRHLAENFSRLAEAIRDEGIIAAEPAEAYLRAAEDALVCHDGPARVIQLVTPELARQAAEALYASRPDWLDPWGEAGRARCVDDLRYHLSYLADSMALNKPGQFADYLRWIAGFLARRDIPRESLSEALSALLVALDAVPDETRRLARQVVLTGLSALTEEADDRGSARANGDGATQERNGPHARIGALRDAPGR